LVRSLVQLLPVVVVFAVLPGPGFVRWMLPLFIGLTVLWGAAAYGDSLRDRRLRQHGLPVPGDEN
jgi:hypothetical protein